MPPTELAETNPVRSSADLKMPASCQASFAAIIPNKAVRLAVAGKPVIAASSHCLVLLRQRADRFYECVSSEVIGPIPAVPLFK